MTLCQQSQWLKKHPRPIAEGWCPACRGSIVQDSFPPGYRLPAKRCYLCLDCNGRWEPHEPFAFPHGTIRMLEWSRAVWQVQQDRTEDTLWAMTIDSILSTIPHGEIR